MRKRSSRPPDDEDMNQAAARIVAQASGQPAPRSPEAEDKRNPAAVALGRLGGLKGGKARAHKLSARRRKQIAQKAAASRWAKK